MKRGEIWVGAAPGDYTGKPRPLLIVRDDRFMHLNSVTVCPITSTITAEISFRPAIDAHPTNGLKQNSQIMIDSP